MKPLTDTVVLAGRALREIPRVPTRIIFPLLIPIMQLVLFASVFANVALIKVAGGGSSLDFLAAGQVALAVMVGAGGSGFQMVQDMESGFFDKLRASPVARSSIVLGLLVTDALRLAMHSLVVLLVALLMGASVNTGLAGAVVIVVLCGFFGACWAGISLNVALRTRNPETTAAAGIIVFPLYFASNAFVPKPALPSWLQTLNEVNPISYLITAVRALMLYGWDTGAVLEGFAAAAVVGAVTLPLAVLAFRRAVSA
jgi:ABC-type multidrug transport system permease subunit